MAAIGSTVEGRCYPFRPMEEIDARILHELQLDGRLNNETLGERVGLSASACSRRVKALVARGVIERFAALINPRQAGLGQTIIVLARVHSTTPGALEAFEDGVRRVASVVRCHQTIGEIDYVLEVAAADLDHFDEIYRKELLRLPGLDRTTSLAAIEEIKARSPLPVFKPGL